MKFSPKQITSFLGLSLFFFTACSKIETPNQNSSSRTAANSDAKNNTQTVRDDIDELGKLVNLPLLPEEATWREDITTNAPNEKKLTAILRFSSEYAQRISDQAQKYQPSTEARIDAETWFPAELVAQSQLSGDETLKGAAFAANDFFKPPYSAGKITRLADANYFVLELNVAP